MPFWRREEPLHEKLAREGGLDFPRRTQDLAGPLSPDHPFWQVAGIHGVPRAREWDAVAAAEAPGLPGDELDFVVVEDGTVVVDLDLPDESLTPLADAIEQSLSPPYHAVARRREDDVWTVAAMKVDVVNVPEEIPGDSVSIAVQGDQRTMLIDDREASERIESLEVLGEQQFDGYVLEAKRLDGQLWEVTVRAL